MADTAADATKSYLVLHLHLLLSIGSESCAAGDAAQDAGHVAVHAHAADGLVLLAAVAQQRLRHRHLLWGASRAALVQLLQRLNWTEWAARCVATPILALPLLSADCVQRQLALPVHKAFM